MPTRLRRGQIIPPERTAHRSGAPCGTAPKAFPSPYLRDGDQVANDAQSIEGTHMLRLQPVQVPSLALDEMPCSLVLMAGEILEQLKLVLTT